MREIKFRGKGIGIANDDWYYGDLIIAYDKDKVKHYYIYIKAEVKYKEEYAQFVIINTNNIIHETEPLGDYIDLEVIRKHI